MMDANDKALRQWAYVKWNAMKRRASGKTGREAYQGCSVSEEFQRFQDFFAWASKQIGFGFPDWHLDKDILKKGNKVYGAASCCFVPYQINSLLIKNKTRRRAHLIGVRRNSTKYRAEVNSDGRRQNLGNYSTPEAAFFAYKKAKEAEIRRVAEQWRSKIPTHVYAALLSYQVEITD